ncbi:MULTISPECIES: PilW family protein [Bacillaceae]|uniref:Prepilin-type N-terminal cleavage/methylation domain-containing protein n=1 Tax=Evansella alkalicola TaxID=745819 RepID=A0ABS6JTK3_9BACI|nr:MULTISPECIES: prepilin-type N-terminal cleavage/methylation domain-containing protein [Bacillaceae]MBU9721918.1 prepilin-type N-terminal cleavage/methylation domain-containing protein [Bacillus alkalicola]
MKMLKNNKGLSLVEILISFALLSLVVLLVTSLHLFGQNQFNSQTNLSDNQANVRLAINILTKEVRNADTVTTENDRFYIDGTEYKANGNLVTIIDGAESTLVPGISEIEITPGEASNRRVDIKIVSVEPEVSHSTVIYIRGEGE